MLVSAYVIRIPEKTNLPFENSSCLLSMVLVVGLVCTVLQSCIPDGCVKRSRQAHNFLHLARHSYFGGMGISLYHSLELIATNLVVV